MKIFRKSVRKLLFFASAMCVTTALAQSQAEMNERARKEFEKADTQLNKVYQELLREGDDESDKALREAQRAWLKFVELHVHYVFPLKEGENPRELYGSIYPMEHAMLKSKLFTERIKQLVDQ